MKNRSISIILFSITFLFFCLTGFTNAKLMEGIARVDSVNTEAYLGQFSFSANNEGKIEGELTVNTELSQRHSTDSGYGLHFRSRLMLAIYDDQQWKQYNKLMSEGSLCADRLTISSSRIILNPMDMKKDVFKISRIVSQKPSVSKSYVVIMDCVLENFKSNPPYLNYKFVFSNGGSHLPADEDGIITLLSIFCIILTLALFVFVFLINRLYAKYNQYHLIALILGTALVSQLVSCALQLCHLLVYLEDGLGLKLRHTWLAFDFLSEMSQLLSELLIAFTLICLAFGWTISDSFKMRALLSPKPLLFLFTLSLTSVYLKYKGRVYEEDFSHFHDWSHWPGMMLILLRCGLLVVFALGMMLGHNMIPQFLLKSPFCVKILVSIGVLSRSHSGEIKHNSYSETNTEAYNFLYTLVAIGSSWFAIFPISVILSLVLPATSRKLLIVTLTLLVHSAVIIILSLNVLQSDSEYFNMSSLKHMGSVLGNISRMGKTAID